MLIATCVDTMAAMSGGLIKHMYKYHEQSHIARVRPDMIFVKYFTLADFWGKKNLPESA